MLSQQSQHITHKCVLYALAQHPATEQQAVHLCLILTFRLHNHHPCDAIVAEFVSHPHTIHHSPLRYHSAEFRFAVATGSEIELVGFLCELCQSRHIE